MLPSLIFQIGDGHLVLHSTDASLSDRFRRLYGDCRVEPHLAHGPRVECRVSPGAAGEVIIDVSDDSPVRIPEFLEAAFADRQCRRVAADADGGESMEYGSPPVRFHVRNRRLTFPADSHWRALVANLAMGLLIRLQHDVIFLHASGVAMGSQGVLFVGPKAAGKTTTALGLASRGHGFLGDEIVGVRQRTWDLVPVLRTISKLDGPCLATLDHALHAASSWPATYASGETRTIVPASALFDAHRSTTRLRGLVFLEGFEETPVLAPLATSLDAARKLTPVTSTLWGQTPTARVFSLVTLLAAAPTFTLKLGPPELTANLLEERFGK